MFWSVQGVCARQTSREQALQYQRNGQLRQARQLFRKLLKQRQRNQLEHPLQIVEILVDLAQVDIDREKFDDAEHWLRQALSVIADHHIKESAIIASLYQTLATKAFYQGDYLRAFDGFSTALEQRRMLFSGHHPLVAESLNGLAMVNYARQNFQPAWQFLQQARAIYAINHHMAVLAARQS